MQMHSCGQRAAGRLATLGAVAFAVVFSAGCGAEAEGGGGGGVDAVGLDGGLDGGADAGGDAAADADDGSGGSDVGVDTFDAGLSAPDWTPDRACNSGGGPLPEGVLEIAWDDGKAFGSVAEHPEWKIADVAIDSATLHEAVRFDLQGPMKIWGYRVMFAHSEAAEDAEVKVGLYRDFGHNGFDFWAPDPIWELGRCGDQVEAGSWVDYRLPQPVVIEQPGLVYVVHRREGKGAPALAFDGSLPEGCKDPNDCCGPFDACHSAWNLPELTQFSSGGQTTFAYNGLSLTRPTDYLVRLLVEPTAVDAPATHRFAAVTDAPDFGHRMAVGDYDGDGWDDVWDGKSHLWRNDKGTFVDVTEKVGIAAMGLQANGGLWGDYDNDGDLDLLTFWESSAGGEHLLRNDNGVFVDVTEAAGLSDLQSYNPCLDGNGKPSEHEPTAAAAWLDLDGDGLLDLYLANFNCWANYTFYVDRMWHNQGDGTFVDLTGTKGFAGEANPKLASRGATPADYDGDGDVDLFVHTYVLLRDLLYRNEGGLQVQEVGQQVGVAGVGTLSGGVKRYGHGIGSAWGDLNGDGRLDLVVANLAHPRFWDFSNKSEVFLQQSDGTFVDLQGSWDVPIGGAGLTFQETHSVPLLGDFDHDGVLDLWLTATYDGRPTEFYLGVGDGSFALARWGSGVHDRNGWGMTSVDVDHDGDLDVVAKALLYRNNGAKGHWLQVRVVGDVSANRAGIGATVRAKIGDKTLLRVVDGGSGQGCQSLGALHFGLGATDAVDSLEITWPGGKKTAIAGPIAADQHVWVTESGKLTPGFAAP